MHEVQPIAPPVVMPPMNGGIPEIAPDSAVCLRCGYQTRGLPTKHNCPECGTPIRRSMLGNLLEFSAPEYVGMLHRGLVLILVATIGQIVAMLLAIVVGVLVITLTAAATGGAAIGSNIDVWVIALSLPFIALALVGWWMFSMPDPAILGQQTGDTPRKIIRITVAITAAVTVINLGLNVMGSNPAYKLGAMAGNLLASIAGTVQFFASMVYIRWLAPRLPDRNLQQRATQYMWLLPLIYIVGTCVLVGPLVAGIMYLLMLNQIRVRLGYIRRHQTAEDQPPLAA